MRKILRPTQIIMKYLKLYPPHHVNSNYNLESNRMCPSTPPNSPLSECREIIKNDIFDSQQEDEPCQDEKTKKPSPRKPKIK